MTETLSKNIISLNKIWGKSYWWGERYDYIESLPIKEIIELRSYLYEPGDIHEMWVQNRGFCDKIIQEHRDKQLKKIIKNEHRNKSRRIK